MDFLTIKAIGLMFDAKISVLGFKNKEAIAFYSFLKVTGGHLENIPLPVATFW